jgi:hypothetical protein
LDAPEQEKRTGCNPIVESENEKKIHIDAPILHHGHLPLGKFLYDTRPMVDHHEHERQYAGTHSPEDDGAFETLISRAGNIEDGQDIICEGPDSQSIAQI